MTTMELLDLMRSQTNHRRGMVQQLGADPLIPCVYYICPLKNLRGILEQGVLPRSQVENTFADISSVDVQHRRSQSRQLQLQSSDGSRFDRPVHQCVNLFWNPLNHTFRAFQRNARLLAAAEADPELAPVCVLELELARILEFPEIAWTLTPRNYAANPFASYDRAICSGERLDENERPYFDWAVTFSAEDGQYDQDANQRRSAEFIVHIGGETQKSSSPLPANCFRRILIPSPDTVTLSPRQREFLEASSLETATPNIFQAAKDLLKPECGFLDSLEKRELADGDAHRRFEAALDMIANFEQEFPQLSPREDLFRTAELAADWHGTTHTVRVMIWAAFLLQHAPQVPCAALANAVLAAAAIHDARRTSNAEDADHGNAAASHFEETIVGMGMAQKLRDDCLDAVRYHCLPDADCENQSAVWKILKDADALDRGRFGKPNSATGCNIAMLRSDVLCVDKYKNIAWMAYYLAGMTAHLNPTTTPCSQIAKAVLTAIRAAADVRNA